MSATEVAWIVAIGVAVAVGGPLLYRRWRASTLVEQNSEALQRLRELNAVYAPRLAEPPRSTTVNESETTSERNRIGSG